MKFVDFSDGNMVFDGTRLNGSKTEHLQNIYQMITNIGYSTTRNRSRIEKVSIYFTSKLVFKQILFRKKKIPEYN